MITTTIDLSENLQVIENKVLDELAKALNRIMLHVKSGVIVGLQDLCDKLIQRTDEYQSLIGREPLLGELGVPDINQRLNGILMAIKRGVSADVIPIRRRGNMLEGGIVFGIIPSDLTYILSLPDASYLTEKGRDIPWLDWLTQQGDRIIITGFKVEVANTASARSRSRTGLALMIKGDGWRVPPEFAGFPHDNFLVNAFNVPGIERTVANIIAREIKLRV
jgi:hypothetical protein